MFGIKKNWAKCNKCHHIFDLSDGDCLKKVDNVYVPFCPSCLPKWDSKISEHWTYKYTKTNLTKARFFKELEVTELGEPIGYKKIKCPK